VSGTSSGSMTLGAGRMISGVGSVTGNLTVGSGALLSPGVNGGIGVLTFGNSLTLAAGSTNLFAISKSPLTNDAAIVSGTLDLGGTLVVTNIGGVALTNGDSFKLFSAASYNGAFANTVLPPLPAGLAWNTSALSTNGTLSVIVALRPAISRISVSDAGLIFSGTGGAADANYYLLGTTNLTTPFTNWTRLLTNQFDGSGNFNFTNPAGADPQSFYLIQLP